MIKKKEFYAPNKLWVSDITARAAPLFAVSKGICLFKRPPRGMITDAYSRKIVAGPPGGWSLHESLQVEGPLAALKMALAANKRQLNKDLIHHCAGSPV